MVIFGATGDLARHKLFPALFSLFKQKKLPEKFFIIGFSRRGLSDTEFRSLLIEDLEEDKNMSRQKFLENVFYQKGNFAETSGYEGLCEKLNGLDKQLGFFMTRLFYLATPPDNYQPILNLLASTKLAAGRGQGSDQWTRVAIEKPFGKNLETARELDLKLAEMFEEKQIFRVDHYLGKEAVQNMLAFRFANGVFEPVWNKNYIDHIQITFSEKPGVTTRGKFFDGVGMLRDVAQNHLLQLIASIAMEPPVSFSHEGVRDARAKAIKAIRRIQPHEVDEQVVRGQYAGYHQEADIAVNSQTETFVALKLFIDTPRLSGVPIYIRAGKKLPENLVEIKIIFIQTCHVLFKEYGCPEIGNVLTIRVQPDEGISLKVIAKTPGTKLALSTVNMGFSYKNEFGIHGANAYEKLLLDILTADQMLFNRSDELESSWGFMTNILEGWKTSKSEIENYEVGTWGPEEAKTLIEKDGRKWI